MGHGLSRNGRRTIGRFQFALLGAVIAGVGLTVLLHAFTRFVIEGIGTPAPVAPTERLVVGGAYRYVRNPMYLAVAALILGQALLLGQPGSCSCTRAPSVLRCSRSSVATGTVASSALRRAVRGVSPRRSRLVASSTALAVGRLIPFEGATLSALGPYGGRAVSQRTRHAVRAALGSVAQQASGEVGRTDSSRRKGA